MKSSQLQIRVSSQQKNAIKRAATRSRMDMSEWVLSQIFPNASTKFEKFMHDLAAAKESSNRSYVLAELNDFFSSISARELEVAISEGPNSKLDSLMQNYVAAMIDLACQKRSIPAPRWLAEVEPLEHPYFATDLQSLRLHLLTSSPPPFRRRNIFIDSSVGDRV